MCPSDIFSVRHVALKRFSGVYQEWLRLAKTNPVVGGANFSWAMPIGAEASVQMIRYCRGLCVGCPAEANDVLPLGGVWSD